MAKDIKKELDVEELAEHLKLTAAEKAAEAKPEPKLVESLTIEVYDNGQVNIKSFPDTLDLISWLGLTEVLKIIATDRAQTVFPTLPSKAMSGLLATAKAVKLLAEVTDARVKDNKKV